MDSAGFSPRLKWPRAGIGRERSPNAGRISARSSLQSNGLWDPGLVRLRARFSSFKVTASNEHNTMPHFAWWSCDRVAPSRRLSWLSAVRIVRRYLRIRPSTLPTNPFAKPSGTMKAACDKDSETDSEGFESGYPVSFVFGCAVNLPDLSRTNGPLWQVPPVVVRAEKVGDNDHA